jgi:hypothetical protein
MGEEQPSVSHVLAETLLRLKRHDLPESGAWGISPAEQYLGRQLGRRQELSHVSLTPREVVPIPFD